MVEKAEKGKVYDFYAVDVLQLPVGGVTSFAGKPSVAYDRLVPADAVIESDGVVVGKVRLTIQPTVGVQSDNVAVATQDNINLASYSEQNLILRCTFV